MLKKLNFLFFGLYGLFNLNNKFSNIFVQKLLGLIMILVQKFWKSYKNLVHSKFLNILIFMTIHLFWWNFTALHICEKFNFCSIFKNKVYIPRWQWSCALGSWEMYEYCYIFGSGHVPLNFLNMYEYGQHFFGQWSCAVVMWSGILGNVWILLCFWAVVMCQKIS